MTPQSPSIAVSLTLLHADGMLSALLTDGRGLVRTGGVAVATGTLETLCDAFDGLLRSAAAPLPAGDAATEAATEAAARALGRSIFDRLLPEPVRAFLSGQPPVTLTLQLPPELVRVPWELAHDGHAALGDLCAVHRRIVHADAVEVSPRAAHLEPPVGVDIAGPGGGADEALGVPALAAMLAGLGFEVRMPSDAAADGAAAGGSARPCTVSHRIWRRGQDGPCEPSEQARLLVLQMHGGGVGPDPGLLALTRPGRDLLLVADGADGSRSAAFCAAFYRALAAGVPLAQAVRRARLALPGAERPVWTPLFGAGELTLAAPIAGDSGMRQVTVLSVDIVGSTALIQTLGAERYSELLSDYHRIGTAVLRRRGGTPDDPQGDDGLMCYFGFPSAREDAAAQAVRAGLDLLTALQPLGLQVRIGLCTGNVVVRDGRPVGAAVHLAARLQAIAPAGAMVMGESTRRLVREPLPVEALPGAPRLKGFDSHEALYLLRPPAPGTASPVDGDRSPTALSPFVGRSSELEWLRSHWSETRAGRMRVVAIVGEAGIGKSRLVREFRRQLIAAGHDVFETRCDPEAVHTPFHPVVTALRVELGLAPGAPAGAGLDGVAALTSPLADRPDAQPLLAELVGLAAPSPAGDATAERRRERTLDLLVALARQRVSARAGCMIVEDVHWLDPSTGELLQRLAADPGLPLLLMLTARPEAPLRLPVAPQAQLDLRGLAPEPARMLVVGAGRGHRLPNDLVHRLAARSDGVPLFIEESTRMAIELGGAGAGAAERLLHAVPATLLDLLTARLDRLGPAKALAQTCAAVGREFTWPLVLAVLEAADPAWPVDDPQLQLRTLREAGLVVRAGGEGERYRFRHALMRDAAYRSLLQRQREQMHRIIALVLRERFADLVQAQPELLAYHLTRADERAEALRCWELAARQAAARSAQVEAIGHLQAALALVEGAAADGPDTDRAEMRLQLMLATRLLATEGYGADRVERVYARALVLAARLGDEAGHMKVMLGLQAYHCARAEFDKALAIAGEAAAAAQGEQHAVQRVQLQWAVANIVMHRGDMVASVEQMDACLAAYDRLQHHAAAVQDPGVMCLCYSAWALWQLGRPDTALDRAGAVVRRAERMQHRFSLGQAYGFLAAIHLFRGEWQEAAAAAARAVAICEQEGYPMWLSLARLIRGRVLAETGEVAAGLEEMRQAHALWEATGTVLTMPFFLAMRAEGLALARRPAEGLELLARAREIIDRCGERYFEAEVLRLHGELLRQWAAQTGADRDEEAEALLLRALDGARARRMHALALRAATSLGTLWQRQGRVAEAVALLRQTCAAVEGGAGTRDPTRARELLLQFERASGTAP